MHKGEIIEKVIRDSGVPIAEVARRLNISRKTMYNFFDKKNLDNDALIKIGKVIHVDLSNSFPQLFERLEEYPLPDLTKLREEVDHWKNKYIELLEEHNNLLRKK